MQWKSELLELYELDKIIRNAFVAGVKEIDDLTTDRTERDRLTRSSTPVGLV